MARRPSVKAPLIDELRLPDLEDAPPQILRERDHVEGVRLRDADTAGIDRAGLSITECEISGWNASETDLRGACLMESAIENLNAPVLIAPRSSWKDIRIDASRVGSGELYEAELTDVIISGSKLGWVNLRGATLRDVIFRSCTFEELDLAGANMTRVAFEDCSAANLDITRSTSRDVDLRGVQFAVLSGIDSLTGTVLSASQAIGIAEQLAVHHGARVDG